MLVTVGYVEEVRILWAELWLLLKHLEKEEKENSGAGDSKRVCFSFTIPHSVFYGITVAPARSVIVMQWQ